MSPLSAFPEAEALRAHLSRRHRRGSLFRLGFLVALLVAVLVLLTLLLTILNDSFGLVASVEQRPEAELVAAYGHVGPLDSLSKDDLVSMLADSIKTNVGRRLERDQRFFADRLVFETEEVWDALCASKEPVPGCGREARSQANVHALVVERVIDPDIIATYPLWDSVVHRAAVEASLEVMNTERRAEAAAAGELDGHQDATLSFRSWVSREFLTRPQSPEAELAGVRTAILGSLWVVLITVVFSLPVGVGAAIYLEEYAPPTRLNQLIRTNINNLAGVPSIIYGMLGLAIFVRAMATFTSGAFLSGETANQAVSGRTIMAAGLTLGLLVLPLIIITSQEAIRAVPRSLREAGLALGATRWQTVRSHVLPSALPGVLTGAILSVARALGETAPLVVVGASTAITFDPDGPFSKFTVLPIQIYQWTSRPQDEFRNVAAAAIIVLLILLFALNATAVVLRNRYSRGA